MADAATFRARIACYDALLQCSQKLDDATFALEQAEEVVIDCRKKVTEYKKTFNSLRGDFYNLFVDLSLKLFFHVFVNARCCWQHVLLTTVAACCFRKQRNSGCQLGRLTGTYGLTRAARGLMPVV